MATNLAPFSRWTRRDKAAPRRAAQLRVRRLLLKIPITVVVAAMPAGCALPIPHQRALSPVFYGTVLDAETSAPVEAVRIEVTDTSGFGHGSAVGYTDAAGKYNVGVIEQARWFVILFPLPGGICSGEAVFTHPKYATHSEVERWYSNFSNALESPCLPVIRNVRLQPTPPNPALEGDRPQAGGASAPP